MNDTPHNAPATVVLTGRPGGTTHLAVEALATLPQEFVLIGGLAVLCRVGVPHRATVDLDTLARNLEGFHPELQHLALSSSGGGQYVMPGRLDLDVIDVATESAEDVIADLSAQGELSDLELNVIAHTWAHDTATDVAIAVVDEDGSPLIGRVDRLVASTAGLVAMKATTVPLRASSKPEKKASDLYDLARLLVGAVGAAEVNTAPDELRDFVLDALHRHFVDDRGRDRTYREIRRFDEVAIDMDEVAGSVEDLAT
ncbi:MAG: nucleotidyl transferase AbiEii/AbiGii toxin family protein [Actinomycetia bacterium]|nr:nucleotidyl transferase AbiEii/AbiGii toxin family protein [Actinomycetes bacterium]